MTSAGAPSPGVCGGGATLSSAVGNEGASCFTVSRLARSKLWMMAGAGDVGLTRGDQVETAQQLDERGFDPAAVLTGRLRLGVELHVRWRFA